MGGINIFILAPSSQAIRPGRDECTFNLGALRIISEGLKNIIFDFLSFPAGCPLYILEIMTHIIYIYTSLFRLKQVLLQKTRKTPVP